MADKYNKVSDWFICPYCFNESKLRKIQFRSNNTKLKKINDKKKSEFWNLFEAGQLKFMHRPDIAPRIRRMGLHTIKNKAEKNVPVLYYDESQCPTEIRLCPSCHNNLPQNIGFVDTSNILVVGESSKESFEYARDLFASLSRDCRIENIKFYTPDESTKNGEPGEKIGKISFEDRKYIVGKAVYATGEKTICEITISYYPLGMDRLKSANESLESQVKLFFQNANGIIFVSDYKKAVKIVGEASLENSLDEYIFKLQNLLQKSCATSDAIPVAIVLKNCEELKDEQDVFKGIFNSCAVNINKSQEVVKRKSMAYYQKMRANFSNMNFFFIPNKDYERSDVPLQYPLEWLVSVSEFADENEKKKGW